VSPDEVVVLDRLRRFRPEVPDEVGDDSGLPFVRVEGEQRTPFVSFCEADENSRRPARWRVVIDDLDRTGIGDDRTAQARRPPERRVVEDLDFDGRAGGLSLEVLEVGGGGAPV
jgi:hypothetical protein